MSGTWMTTRAWLLMLPLLVVMVAVIGWPLVDTVGLSFTDARLVGTAGHFVGFDNYTKMLSSSNFQRTLVTTTWFAVISVAAEMVIGVLAALLLNQHFHGRAVLRALLILPWALPTVVNATLWRLIYNPEYGVTLSLPSVVGRLGVTRVLEPHLHAAEREALDAVVDLFRRA